MYRKVQPTRHATWITALEYWSTWSLLFIFTCRPNTVLDSFTIQILTFSCPSVFLPEIPLSIADGDSFNYRTLVNLHRRTFLLNCLGVRSIKFGKNLVTDIPRPILHSIRPQPRLLGTVDWLYIISVTYLTVCLSVCHSTWNNIDTQSQVNQLEWPPKYKILIWQIATTAN